MNMAHGGGEDEAPTNTMYAFKRAEALGADMLELDVHSTKDGKLVVIHDATVDRTTNGTGKVESKTLAQLKKLDNAYDFTPAGQKNVYPMRGIRTGKKPTPAGYTPADFTVPTLKEVFDAFPNTPVNVEIKGTSDTDVDSFKRTGRLLADFLNKRGRTKDVVVASFNDLATEDFHRRAPKIGLSPGMAQMAAYFLADVKPMPGTVALQIPVQYQGIKIATREFIARAHRDGYAVHIWFSGTATENRKTYNSLIDICADALMPAKPSLLENILDTRGLVRPGKPGIDPCGIKGPRR